MLTNYHDQYASQHTLASTKTLANETSSDGTDEAPNLVNGDNQSDEIRTITGVGINTESLGECRAIDKPSHQPIVKTNEEKAQTRQRGDGEKKGISL